MQVVIEKINPLTPMQSGLLFHSLHAPKSRAYFQQISLRLQGKLDLTAVEETYNLLIKRHEVFRSVFVLEGVEEPLHLILAEREGEFHFTDLSRLSSEEQAEALRAYQVEDRERGFVLTQDVLMRIAVLKLEADLHTIIWSFHHIIMDGWSMGIVMKEFFEVYQALTSGQLPRLKPVHSYSNYLRWLNNRDIEEASVFWQDYLKDYTTLATIPKFISLENPENISLQEMVLTFEEALTGGLEHIARKNQVTLHTVFQSLWGILLGKYNNMLDVVFGTVVSGRPMEVVGIDRMVGLFINTIPARITYTQQMTFAELIKQVQAEALTSQKYEFYPLADVQSLSMLKQNLLDHIIVFENYPLEKKLAEEIAEFTVLSTETFEATNYQLNLVVLPGAELRIKVKYNAQVYTEAYLLQVLKHLKTLAEQVVKDDARTIRSLELLSAAEKRCQVYEFNQTQAAYLREVTVVQRFEEQVTKNPEQIALTYREQQMTYCELNSQANRLARHLQHVGLQPGQVVAIMAERTLEVIVGIWAILKAGGVYLPIDPHYPEERIKFILQDSGAELLLAPQTVAEGKYPKKEQISLDLRQVLHYPADNLGVNVKPMDPVYIIYTSGSTGTPKGVIIHQQGLMNYLQWAAKTYLASVITSFPLYSSLAFDLTITSLFLPLISGKRIVVYNEPDGTALSTILRENQVEIIKLTPAHLKILSELDEGASKLRCLIVGGEELPTDLAEKIYCKFYREIIIYNEYGPTETVVGCMIYQYKADGEKRVTVPIGKPIDNTQIYLLGQDGLPVPLGAPGEIFIAGDGVALGYLNRVELTEERFLPVPFEQAGRMYRTGDLARSLPDGNVEFLGRIDQQVKIHGYRIEVGEIEAQLIEHPLVRDVVVVAERDRLQNQFLCAYLVLTQQIELSQLKEYLRDKLPAYMIPQYFCEVKQIPLTANGKVDRRALPKPDLLTKAQYVAPTNAIEETLVAILAELFGLARVGIEDDFFELGGNSIMAIKLVIRANNHGLKLGVQDLFDLRNVKALARKLAAPQQSVRELPAVEAHNPELHNPELHNPELHNPELRSPELHNAELQLVPLSLDEKINPHNLLLTGATGFLGMHILEKLLLKTSCVIHCIIRGRDEVQAKERFAELVKFYFGDRYTSLFGSRVKLIVGDITAENLGLEPALYTMLGEQVDGVIHAAALVKHYGEYSEFARVNLLGTEHVIDFCQRFGVRLHHISTLSVSGTRVRGEGPARFTEKDFYIGQNYQENIYVQSKFEAENRIYKAMTQGLAVTVYRVGNLTGRYQDGHFQKNIAENSFYNLLKSIIELKHLAVEYLEREFEFTPVDWCSEAVVDLLLHQKSANRIFHLHNTKLIRVREILAGFENAGIDIQLLPQSEFEQYVERIGRDAQHYHQLMGIAHYAQSAENSAYPFAVHVDATYTETELAKLGFTWPEIDQYYIARLIQHMKRVAYVEDWGN